MPFFRVKYYAGTYSGIREVQAEDEEDALNAVRGWIRKTCTLPMYSSGVKIIHDGEKEGWDDDPDDEE